MQILRKANTATLLRGRKPRKAILHVSLFTKKTTSAGKAWEDGVWIMEFMLKEIRATF